MFQADTPLSQNATGRNGADVRLACFIAALLSPLPEAEEQADSAKYRKVILRDKMREWDHHMEMVRLADAQHTVQVIRDRDTWGITREGIECYQASCAAQLRQCLIPAPTVKEMRWKERVLKMRDAKDPRVTAGLAAIEADRGRLARELGA